LFNLYVIYDKNNNQVINTNLVRYP
jgi:hypothetical protein